MKQPEVETFFQIPTGQLTLLCPHCGSTYTNVRLVRIGARKEDREPVMLTVDPLLAQVTAHHAEGEMVSDRRSWVELHVDCEACVGGVIDFAQHKGETYVRYRVASTTD